MLHITKTSKKLTSQNRWFIIAACVVIVLAVIRQPSLKTLLPIFGQYQWQQLVLSVQQNQQLPAQQLWQFREFYARGEIFLSRYQQLDIPTQLLDTFVLPGDFQPYLLFKSDKIWSLEGLTTVGDLNSVAYQQLFEKNTIIFSSPTAIIWQSKDNSLAYIAVSYSIPEAAKANGYLYFDLRDTAFSQSSQGKQWFMLTVIKL